MTAVGDEDSDFSESDDVLNEEYNENLKKSNNIPNMDIKKSVLLIGSRKISRLHKKFILDLARLIPHTVIEKKIDRKMQFIQLNSLLVSNKCQWAVYIESTKRNLDRSAVALWLVSHHGYRIKLIIQ